MYVLDGDYETEGPEDFASLIEAYSKYREYLKTNKHRFAKGAYALASAEWRNSRDDHRSLHDAWLESFTVNLDYDNNSEVEVTIVLLGPFHDGLTVIEYSKVLCVNVDGWHDPSDLGDLVRDEVRLSDKGNVIHEIQWAGGCRWMIEAADLHHSWNPISEE